ncbi:DNA double-strand break repair nuclease NurA [Halalkalicoccus sp. NIPERK01]|uniref:DNA double-strand break repair nuclease NurA n=1 Tax=Halalkalicoccus sp. NIPERK01 TaxID=3053469 RepID=UPI00256EBAFE|nr:DNA double-strand break repair nuclease NurA [Halalkalicoccus sp. NIPERK01]MDL5361514.1 DNA double-strand break repair nuclease NurA [Halalkalicoccus sp. NIPERK01]
MTLDPVHFEGIAALARQVGREVDDASHREFAETVWEGFLDPLEVDGRRVLEPVGEQYRKRVAIEDAALCERPFPGSYGVDSGTINPTTYKNGVVMDVAHAAMGRVPTDLDCHRSRTVIIGLHADDDALTFPEDWVIYDEGYSRRRILLLRDIDRRRYTEATVHALSLYLAESEHALANADGIDDLLVLDGPLYPKGLLSWRDRAPELAAQLEEETPRQVVASYARLVENFLDRGVPIAGFVKNPASKRITTALDERTPAPWADDAALFVRLLERREDGERVRTELTYTNWFVSRGGTDRTFAADGDALGLDLRRPAADYEVTFFAIYDPRDDVLYTVEAPYGVTKDEETREALQTQMLSEVASQRGPPEAIAKADELARISAREKESLRRMIEGELDTELSRTYDDLRWGGEEAFF